MKPTPTIKTTPNNFILIGAAGYVAPKHLKAIKAVGGNLVAALDPCDSVGVLDSYFPEAKFFTKLNQLERYVERIGVSGKKIDYVSICSPNYLHDAHCRFAMRIGAEAICEKPLTLYTRNLLLLARQEQKYLKKINVILQLRLSPKVQALKEIQMIRPGRCRVKVRYVTPRGPWYHQSWKGDVKKSGGLATNIGIHIFDLLIYLFGKCANVTVLRKSREFVVGKLALRDADVEFLLSTSQNIKPQRSLSVNGNTVELSNGFNDMHVKSYRKILAGQGFHIKDITGATSLVEKIRNA